MINFYKKNKIDCGNCPVGQFCCSLKVKLSFFDRMRIFFHTGKFKSEYAEELFSKKGWGLKLVKGWCTFLKKDEQGRHYCGIYSARPTICRKFPHFFEKVESCEDIATVWKGHLRRRDDQKVETSSDLSQVIKK